MRNYNPRDKYEQKEAKRLKAPKWMLDLLKVNPSYTCWGPYEDYMSDGGINSKSGWNSPISVENWKEFGPWGLDCYNEVVNFYFEIEREQEECKTCGGACYHPDSLWVSESFYSHSSPFTKPNSREDMGKDLLRAFGAKIEDPITGRGTYPSEALLQKYGPEFRAFCEEMKVHGAWNDRITPDEVAALVESSRLIELTREWNSKTQKWEKKKEDLVIDQALADRVNRGQKPGPEQLGLGHDAINRGILIETRLKRFGMPKYCPDCEGHGRTFTAPEPRLGLILWILHPRKGCSRGVEVKSIEQSELPEVFEYLNEAAKRNAERFSKLVLPKAPKKAAPKAKTPKLPKVVRDCLEGSDQGPEDLRERINEWLGHYDQLERKNMDEVGWIALKLSIEKRKDAEALVNWATAEGE